MSELKWIKITTHIFDDEKMKLIDQMPERDAILVIWLKILVQAGKANASGALVLNDTIPFNDEMLSAIFARPLNTIRLALETFRQFGMIEILDRGNGQCAYYVTNWGKYQQESTAIEQRRLVDKLRKQASRSKAKLLPLDSGDKPDGYEASRDGHGTDSGRGVDMSRDVRSLEVEATTTVEEVEESLFGHVASDSDHLPSVRSAIPPMVAKLVESWNQAVAGTAIPRVRDITPSRTKKAKVRLRERSLEEWDLVFRKISESSFCKGGGRDAWVASFDWIISNDGNAAKVLEGYYDNRVPSRGAVVNRVNHVADATGGKSFEELEREAALRLESGEPYRWVGRM